MKQRDFVERSVEAHALFSGNGGADSPPWMRELRRRAIADFRAAGLPTTRREDWRFTSVQRIAETEFRYGAAVEPPPAAEVEALELCEARRHLLVFVNGRIDRSLSSVLGLPEGVVAGSLAEVAETHGEVVSRFLAKYASTEDRAFAALNTAFIEDGAFLYVPPGVAMEEPVQFLHVTVASDRPTMVHPRCLVVVEPLARASVVETYAALSEDVYLTNAVTELVVRDGGRLDCYRVQRESERAYHVATTHTAQGRDSVMHLHPVVFGGALSRHDITVLMDGENGESVLNGLYLIRGSQHVDHHTTIDHARPHCESHEYFNGVLDERSRGVFNGRIVVRPGAQRTDSKQTNNNLVLSEDARADSQPQLEIYADDVRCTHGATLGPIDEKALFYLQTRGVSPADARSLLTYGFGAEIIDRMEIAPLQAQLDRLVRRRLLAGAGARG